MTETKFGTRVTWGILEKVHVVCTALRKRRIPHWPMKNMWCTETRNVPIGKHVTDGTKERHVMMALCNQPEALTLDLGG